MESVINWRKWYANANDVAATETGMRNSISSWRHFSSSAHSVTDTTQTVFIRRKSILICMIDLNVT